MARIRSIKPEFWKNEQQSWGFARGNLYLVQEGELGPIKFGVAGHPMRRLSCLQCGNPRPLHLRAVFEGEDIDCVEIEGAAKKYFAEQTVRGEWVEIPLRDALRFLTAFSGET